jgi:hypothetical protein
MEKIAFREGFIEKIAELGIGPDEMEELLSSKEVRADIHDAVEALAKQAVLSINSMDKEAVGVDLTVPSPLEGVGTLLKGIGQTGKYGLLAALLLPAAAGAATGYGFTPRLSKEDLVAMKDMELLRDYQQAIDTLQTADLRRRAVAELAPTLEEAEVL